MIWSIIFMAVVVILIAITFRRNANHNYRTESGLFKNSEFNLDEKEELSDKDYYDKDGLMK